MKYDYLIVGQGLAGSTLAHKLLAKGKKVLVYDQEKSETSSKVAAGIMNPVTGRRFVKSWRFDEFYQSAKSYYQKFEVENNVSIFHEIEIRRALFNHEEQHDFLAKIEQEAYATYLSELSVDQNLKLNFIDALAWVGIKGARLDFGPYLESIKATLIDSDAYKKSYLKASQINKDVDLYSYESNTFEKVVFCEGFEMKENPFFKDLPTVPAKGEVLFVKVPGLQRDKIYKHKCFLVPLVDGETFWVGSTYEWDFEDEQPTEVKRAFLVDKLKQSLNVPFEIVGHKAAVRPTGKDRRPYLGESKDSQNLYLFNSFGTKGASLVPYWADRMIEFMEQGALLDKEIDVRRLYKN